MQNGFFFASSLRRRIVVSSGGEGWTTNFEPDLFRRVLLLYAVIVDSGKARGQA